MTWGFPRSAIRPAKSQWGKQLPPPPTTNSLCSFVCFSDQFPDGRILETAHDNFDTTFPREFSVLPYQQRASLLSKSFGNLSPPGPPLLLVGSHH